MANVVIYKGVRATLEGKVEYGKWLQFHYTQEVGYGKKATTRNTLIAEILISDWPKISEAITRLIKEG